MKYDPQKHHRQSIRFKGYDYSQPGGYFVTVVAQNRECLFGEIVEREMRLSRAGRIVQQAWTDLPNHYSHVVLDEFVIMPNHVHGIIVLTDTGRGRSISGGIVLPDQDRDSMEPVPDPDQTCPYTIDKSTRPYDPRPGTRHALPEIVRAFKSFSARRINALRRTPGRPVWQRNYYERIIRDEAELKLIREYIRYNPTQWESDQENPGRG